MWDDRFLFVTAALIAIAVVLEPRLARMQRTVRFGRRHVRIGCRLAQKGLSSVSMGEIG
jgi:hypothetical protein